MYKKQAVEVRFFGCLFYISLFYKSEPLASLLLRYFTLSSIFNLSNPLLFIPSP